MADDPQTQEPDAARIRQVARQRLESLYRAGVQQLPRPVVATESPLTPAAAVTSESPVRPGSDAVDPSPQLPGPSHESPAAANPGASDVGLTTRQRMEELSLLSQQVAECTACKELCSTRTQTVFGVGNPAARLCFLGEAPGADEDRLGEPFVGRAGKLLTKIIEAMTLKREDVYILNILKCRPPGNRNPAPHEVANCRPFFEQQLEVIRPEFICCLGAVAATNLLETNVSIGKLRGKFHDWNGYRIMATYHPAYLLRNPAAKSLVWDDMQILMREMGLVLPG